MDYTISYYKIYCKVNGLKEGRYKSLRSFKLYLFKYISNIR